MPQNSASFQVSGSRRDLAVVVDEAVSAEQLREVHRLTAVSSYAT
ncbi:MAG: hypothetical protein U1F68_18700 [Gammaproteobacteria bacterium]